MNVNLSKVNSIKESAISEFNKFVESKGFPTNEMIQYMSTMELVGFFLKVHSHSPEDAVRKYLRQHNISYRKANEVKTLIHIITQ